jgi:hypothetical protein
MHAAVGDEHGARDPIRRHVGERCAQAREQPRAVGLAVGGAGLDGAHFKPLNAAQALRHGGACGLGLLVTFAEALAWALVDDDDRNGWQRLAVLARERRIGERQRRKAERERAHPGTAAPDREQQHGADHRDRDRGPKDLVGHQRREGDSVTHQSDLLSSSWFEPP